MLQAVATFFLVPLQMSFTMPWTASTAFSHPLVNIKSSNANQSLTNYLSSVRNHPSVSVSVSFS
jgi:hypothetical protein